MKLLQKTINCGTFKLEVLMTENQELFVDLNQFVSISSINPYYVLRNLKLLMGKDFQFLQLENELTNKVDVVPIEKIPEILLMLATKGDNKATFTLKMLLGLAVTKLECDAFGVEFNAINKTDFNKADFF